MNAVTFSNHCPFEKDVDSCEVAYARAAGFALGETIVPKSKYDAFQWLIISIGQRDAEVGQGWCHFGRTLGRLFARPQPNELANPRLEQLRKMAALASKQGWQVPPSEMSAFLRAGWTDDQLELLIETVAPPTADEFVLMEAMRIAA